MTNNGQIKTNLTQRDSIKWKMDLKKFPRMLYRVKELEKSEKWVKIQEG